MFVPEEKIPFNYPTLTDNALLLRTPKTHDALTIAKIVGNSRMRENGTDSRFQLPWSSSQVRTWCERMDSGDTPTELVFLMKDVTTNTAIGLASINSIDWIFRGAEIKVFDVANKYKKKSYVTKAITLLLDYAFKTLNLHRIQTRTISSDTKTTSNLEQLGFQKEGVERDAIFQKGAWKNVDRHALLEGDWRAGV